MPPDVKALVVDDEPLIRWSLSEALGDHGFEVTVAGDGRGAVQALGDGPLPDVVLLDYKLPDSNGLTLFQTIRCLMPAGHVILMTAFGTPEVTSNALALGAYQVVTKPFEIDDIAAMIRHARGAACLISSRRRPSEDRHAAACRSAVAPIERFARLEAGRHYCSEEMAATHDVYHAPPVPD